MLDNRLQTFLTLCETCNYTKTAQKLNMTQPAVSQQIQFLENHYQVVLISGKGKNFSLTDEGRALQEYARTLSANSERILPLLHRIRDHAKPLIFGATLTIGEYTVPPILNRLFREDPKINISMFVENTQILQKMLWDGKIDFALLEGHFNHSQFEYREISNETFVGVCSPDNRIAATATHLEELLDHNLILREPGSGTRDIFENALYNKNLSIDDFSRKIEIGNMNAIKKLCHQNVGITFMYREAIKKEVSQGYLKEIPLQNFKVDHPFNFVYLKNCPDKTQIEYWFHRISDLRNT
ncbi:LysR family transcriptional regulator [Youngiibacter fragilis]|uniref:LysR family transcriptional regulator n=1 Tax=Youngiibacter fragilis 232.1 TaxID=994573 RepID=V7I4I8_9CLOT|nr:LysR family transcriptional regulator [Youngiibacter fragilis]ETA81145.1 LysR family transcriptional regulator [Youngiibacter fragilis 232.1]